MHIVRIIAKTLLYAVLALILLGAGTIISLYSPWTQDMLREAVVKRFASDADTRISVGSFRLRPPCVLSSAMSASCSMATQ